MRRGALLGLALLLLAAMLPLAGAAARLQASAVPSATTGDPGDVITVTLAMDNMGPANAAKVWANVTLPRQTTYVSDNANSLPPFAGSWSSGLRRGFNFTSLPVANSTFGLSFQILVGPANGTVLTLTFAVNYTDETGALQTQSIGTARVTVLIPTIVLTKTPSVNPVDPGASLTYTVVVANLGGAPSTSVWVNDTLPAQVASVRVNPPSFRGSCNPQPAAAVNCVMSNLAAGTNRTYSIDVTVRATAVRGTTFRNFVFANYTDSDGTLLTPVSASASDDVRVIRDLTVGMAPDTPYSFPGQDVSFTIWYNDTAGGSLGATWINDTLPVGMTYASSAPSGTVAGSSVRWAFGSVASGSHSIRLTATISASVLGGTVLVNGVTGDYVTGAGQKGQQVEATASVLVSADVPLFEFTKVADAPTVLQNGTVRYTVSFNNTGTNTSAQVVVEDTIPPGTTLANPNIAPSAQAGRRYTWRFANVAAGAGQTLTYELVLQGVPVGTNLVNAAYLNFTDSLGGPLPSPPFRSAVVRVTARDNGGGPGGGGGLLLPLVAGIVVALAVAGVVAYRIAGARGRTVIDEVFLLHRDGLLIKHYTRRVRPDVDSDILSGMLIAVQNFVNESFLGAEGLQKEGTLDELRFGEFKIVIERGQHVIVAAVLTGDPTNRVKAEVKAAIKDLEGALGPVLDGWSGDMRSVEGADRFIQDLIGGKYRGARAKG